MHMATTCNYISAINKFSPSANPFRRDHVQILIHLVFNHLLGGAEIITQSSGKIVPILGENHFPKHAVWVQFSRALFISMQSMHLFEMPDIRPFNHYRNQNLIAISIRTREGSFWRQNLKSLHGKDSTFHAGIIAPTHYNSLVIFSF